MIVVFAGRRPGSDAFPDENVSIVKQRIHQAVAELRPRLAIGSAAAGADLLTACAALAAGARVEILLAGGKERFQSESVDDKGPSWSEQFNRLLCSDAVSVTEVLRVDDADVAYRAVTAAIVERAEQLAEEQETIALLAMSSPRDEGVDHTEEMVALARQRGWRVLRIDTARENEPD